MKKRIIAFIMVLAAAVAGFGAGRAFGAGGAQPGSQGDPLVTLSYLNSRLEDYGGGQGDGSFSGFRRVSLTKGQKLILTDGSELVVYSGNGTVLGTTGMISLTGGEFFAAGTSVVLYAHFLGIGGNSGVSASGSMTVYVKGGYSVE